MDTMLVRPEQAAEVLNLGRSTLYELLHTGELESVLIGRSRRIPVEALRAFVDRQRDDPVGSAANGE